MWLCKFLSYCNCNLRKLYKEAKFCNHTCMSFPLAYSYTCLPLPSYSNFPHCQCLIVSSSGQGLVILPIQSHRAETHEKEAGLGAGWPTHWLWWALPWRALHHAASPCSWNCINSIHYPASSSTYTIHPSTALPPPPPLGRAAVPSPTLSRPHPLPSLICLTLIHLHSLCFPTAFISSSPHAPWPLVQHT